MHSILPSAWYRNGDALFDVLRRYFPPVEAADERMAYLISTASRYDYDPRLAHYALEDDFVFIQPRHFMEGSIYGDGRRRDEWGCMWHKAEPGISGVVIESPLADWRRVGDYRWPDGAAYWRWDPAEINQTIQAARSRGKSILAYAGNLFEKLQWVRGFEGLMTDMVDYPERVMLLAEKVTEFDLQTIRAWRDYDVDVIFVEDDWGTQTQLMIRPQWWRKLFRPYYARLFDEIHGQGRPVLFHSDGFILPIIPDLIELGCDVLNPQFSCQDLRALADLTAGKVCVMCDVDRQFVLPHGTPEQVRGHVQRIFELFARPEGGLIFRGQVNADCPLENVDAMYEVYATYAPAPRGLGVPAAGCAETIQSSFGGGNDMTRAEALNERATRCLPGGVCSSGRIEPFIGHPFFVERGEGAKVWDVDGREFYDLNSSYGTTHLGHGHPKIREAIVKAAELGIVCTYETEYITDLAEKIIKIVPCAEMVRFLCSGTECTQTAVRLARGHTGREKVIKFEGHFHGFNDYLNYSYPGTALDKLGPETAPNVVPASGGIPAAMLDLVRVLPFNNLEMFEETLKREGHEIAAVVMEACSHNSGSIYPRPGYLEAVRELTRKYGIVLIFDEIITGFRKCPGGAQEYFGVTPDLCTMGKALGAGTPISAFAGTRDVMSSCSPLGKAEHRGTYNGNLVPVMAANAFLDMVVDPDFQAHLERIEGRFYGGFQEIIDRRGIKCQLQYLGARFSVLFGLEQPPTEYRESVKRDAAMMIRFVRELRKRGIYICNCWHHGWNAAYSESDVDECLNRIDDAMTALQ
jgi:glutamate-1-semialdehyde-2,1-aminomutase